MIDCRAHTCEWAWTKGGNMLMNVQINGLISSTNGWYWCVPAIELECPVRCSCGWHILLGRINGRICAACTRACNKAITYTKTRLASEPNGDVLNVYINTWSIDRLSLRPHTAHIHMPCMWSNYSIFEISWRHRARGLNEKLYIGLQKVINNNWCESHLGTVLNSQIRMNQIFRFLNILNLT